MEKIPMPLETNDVPGALALRLITDFFSSGIANSRFDREMVLAIVNHSVDTMTANHPEAAGELRRIGSQVYDVLREVPIVKGPGQG
jgi:hypothetical protein